VALLALSFLSGCQNGEETPVPAPIPVTDVRCRDDAPSPAPLRRLTRFEYENTLHELFGSDLVVLDLFPPDEIGLGFDNQGGTLSTTDLHVVGYLEAAGRASAFVAEHPERLTELAGCAEPSAECAEALIAELGRRLERAPLSDASRARLVALFGEVTDADTFVEGAGRVVEALLQSPRFLYRVERASAGDVLADEPAALASPFVLASRLSFLFLGAGPDGELLRAAESGGLATPDDVAREARRLLEDPRSRRGVLHFYRQWLELARVGDLEKDRRLFGIWTDDLRLDLERETTRFLEAVLWEDDARFSTLLRADYTFVDAVLADYYGLPITDPDSTELIRVTLGPKAHRRGLLTHGSILSLQAKVNQTDPIHRGKFVRERFFCTPPPPPPADLVVSPPALDPRKTTRERFAQHRADTACAGCHELLDPVGLAFENYDAIGRYRETEADSPVDATGYLYDTDVDGPIDGVADLADKLVSSREVGRCVVTQWFRFAMGRGETEADACTIDKLDAAFNDSGGDLRELLIALTRTEAFLRAAPAEEFGADDRQGELARGDLVGVAGRGEAQFAGGQCGEVPAGRAGGLLVDRAEDGGDDQQWRVGVTVADGVQEAVHGRRERAQPEAVGVHDVDTEFEADQVRGRVADRAGDERLQVRTPAEAEVDQLHSRPGCDQRGPGPGRMRRVRAVADRAAVVQPDAPGRGDRLDRGIGAQGNELGGLVVRQPDLDRLRYGGQPGHAQCLRLTAAGLGGTGRQVDRDHIAALRGELCVQLTVDEDVVHAVGARGSAGVVALRRQGVELDRGRAGAEHEAHAGGLRVDHGHLAVVVLRSGPGGEAVWQDAALGLLEVERAAQQVDGDGGGDHEECLSGQVWRRESMASRIRGQLAPLDGSL
jgi:hypothetical protein